MMTKPKKLYLGKSVLEASQERISFIFDRFEKIYISFSAGKDSTVMLHLVMDEAMKRNRKVGLVFIDWEAQFSLTINHALECFEMYDQWVIPFWICVPLTTTNACSQVEPEWTCWQESKKDLWVRSMPSECTTAQELPFYTEVMTFEDFVPAFGDWFSEGKPTAAFVGIRSRESLNRWRSIAGHGVKFEGINWTNHVTGSVFNAYPIYDWHEHDIWRYHAKTRKPYNRLYDRMHQAGLKLSQMRICEPYGDEQRRGLWLYQIVEPETWSKVVSRVAGANTGAEYAGERGNVLGNGHIKLPSGHTWKSFAHLLLDSMPTPTSEHYKNKIAVFIRWYQKRGMEMVDSAPGDTAAKDHPSWRRICKMLLKNDYWAKSLSFSPTKGSAYSKYQAMMLKRRKEWGIYD